MPETPYILIKNMICILVMYAAGDHQKCCQDGSICWKTCCVQYHVQRVMLSDVCVV